MSKKNFKVIESYFKDLATSKPDDNNLIAQQKDKSKVDRLASKKADSSLPKNNSSVFAAKPEPNRGPGTDRRPTVPRAHRTGPTSEEFAMSVGSGAVPSLTNPSDAYSAELYQKQKKKSLGQIKTKMIKRKNPVK